MAAVFNAYNEWRIRYDNLLELFHDIATWRTPVGHFELDRYYLCAYVFIALIAFAFVFIAIELLLCETFPKLDSRCFFQPRPHRINNDWVAYGRYPPWRHDTNWTVYWRFD